MMSLFTACLLLIVCFTNNVFCGNIISKRQVLLKDTSILGSTTEENVGQEFGSADANELHRALEGIGTDDDKVIDIIPKRTNEQRQKIIEAYSHKFDSNLIEDLKSDLSGHYRQTIVSLMLKPEVFAAKELHKMMTSLASVVQDKTGHINDVLLTKTGNELLAINAAYKETYGTTIKKDLEQYQYPDDQLLLYLLVLTGNRTIGDINLDTARQQVLLIPEDHDKCNLNKSFDFMKFLAHESFDQIRYVVAKYEVESNYTSDIEDQLQTVCADEFLRDSILTIVRFAKDPRRYYAEKLFNAMIGLGTNDDALIRTIVSRSEKDLHNIKEKYEELYNRTLSSSVEADTSGNYRKVLLAVIENTKVPSELN